MSKERAAIRVSCKLASGLDHRFSRGAGISGKDSCLKSAAFPRRAASSSGYRSISTSAVAYTSTPRAVDTSRHGAHLQKFFVLRGCDCNFCDLLRIQPEKPEVPRGNTRASTLGFAAGTFPSTLFRTF